MNFALLLQSLQREYFSPSYKIAFLNAMELRLRAGVSLGKALRAVIEAESHPAKRRDMAQALQALEAGETVASAMVRLGFFDPTVIAILTAGERAGMSAAISAAVTHLQVRQSWFRQHAVVWFVLANEMLSVAYAPVLLYTEILPWMRRTISEPTAPAALMAYHRDMQIAQNLTTALLVLNVLLFLFAVVNAYRVRRLLAAPGVLMFFADGSMSVGFRLAAAMLQSGVTIEAAARELALQAPGWARRYWQAVNHQLESSIEPAQALLQRGVYLEEQSLLASHANARQLAQTCNVLSDGRAYRARRARDLLLVGATVVTVVYVFMTLSVAAWIYLTYDATLGAGLEALKNGF